ncbi:MULTISPECIES: hypothetical protein [Eikenella]|uniref:Uncharacterized protein n=1 Tax=Eikenella exigua TaxID=2528037 RepID=A0AAX1F8J6_9NEIS|nr:MULTISPECIES: hypothetical protein [Eikenella]QED92411.1 hypothetical protein EZJ17_07165 [Eikenella exigua]
MQHIVLALGAGIEDGGMVGRHSLLPGHGLADSGYQEIGIGVFQNIAVRTELEAFLQVVGIFRNGKHRHGGLGKGNRPWKLPKA